MTLTAETSSALADALAKVGLELAAPAPGLANSMPGPLVNLMGMEGGAPLVVVAVVDKPEVPADSIIQSVGGAISRVRPELALRPMDPVADLDDLVGSVAAPADVLPVTSSGEVIGAIIWSEDRRSGPDEAADAIRAAGQAAGPGAAGTVSLSAGASQLTRLRDVQLSVSVELGRTTMSVSEVLSLEIGSVIELDRAAGAPIDVRVNGTLLARGEVVVVDDEYAIRVTEMIDPDRG